MKALYARFVLWLIRPALESLNREQPSISQAISIDARGDAEAIASAIHAARDAAIAEVRQSAYRRIAVSKCKHHFWLDSHFDAGFRCSRKSGEGVECDGCPGVNPSTPRRV
ncbi:hypothetical protein [Cupriavidus malaysiensis]|uniref:Uncharacterized protein n=1 Tax=Cupriavidus malaysiensis TaxID=367825 RepID=A0ABM6F5L8_9BURK|nr:hypothetical protein [Cupriavidus malaysiensis]AOZ06791.1 hypothetical protein BKK80_13910 [Cupriavidus malaysiensis]